MLLSTAKPYGNEEAAILDVELDIKGYSRHYLCVISYVFLCKCVLARKSY